MTDKGRVVAGLGGTLSNNSRARGHPAGQSALRDRARERYKESMQSTCTLALHLTAQSAHQQEGKERSFESHAFFDFGLPSLRLIRSS